MQIETLVSSLNSEFHRCYLASFFGRRAWYMNLAL